MLHPLVPSTVLASPDVLVTATKYSSAKPLTLTASPHFLHPVKHLTGNMRLASQQATAAGNRTGISIHPCSYSATRACLAPRSIAPHSKPFIKNALNAHVSWREPALPQQARRMRRHAVPADVATNGDGAASIEEKPEFSVVMEVRDSELDQYSVVNNSVYNNYLQHARHKLLEHVGCDADEVARSGDALALASMNIKYLGPLRSRDVFLATVSMKKVTGARLILHQEIRRVDASVADHGEPVLEAEAVVVWLDQSYKPKRIPTDMLSRFRSFSESVQIRG